MQRWAVIYTNCENRQIVAFRPTEAEAEILAERKVLAFNRDLKFPQDAWAKYASRLWKTQDESLVIEEW
jgi:hypothetical protein